METLTAKMGNVVVADNSGLALGVVDYCEKGSMESLCPSVMRPPIYSFHRGNEPLPTAFYNIRSLLCGGDFFYFLRLVFYNFVKHSKGKFY